MCRKSSNSQASHLRRGCKEPQSAGSAKAAQQRGAIKKAKQPSWVKKLSRTLSDSDKLFWTWLPTMAATSMVYPVLRLVHQQYISEGASFRYSDCETDLCLLLTGGTGKTCHWRLQWGAWQQLAGLAEQLH
jgi:hypothetical protein